MMCRCLVLCHPASSALHDPNHHPTPVQHPLAGVVRQPLRLLQLLRQRRHLGIVRRLGLSQLRLQRVLQWVPNRGHGHAYNTLGFA